MQNQNSVDYLEKIKIKIFENLKETTFVPSVELQDIPRISFGMDDEDDDMLDDADEDDNPDVRMTQRRLDETTEASGELSDSENEDSDFLGPKGKKATSRRRNERNSKENGSALSDIDETGGHSSERSASPKSNASESEAEDVEMKDAVDITMDIDAEEKVNDGSPHSKASSTKHSPELPDTLKTEERVAGEPASPGEANKKDLGNKSSSETSATVEEEETSSK
jgi:histone deacetylase 1/2